MQHTPKRNYTTTYRLLNIIQLIGWGLAAISAYAAYAIGNSDGFLSAALTATLPFAAGLLLMAVGQVGGAIVDIAQDAGEIVAERKTA